MALQDLTNSMASQTEESDAPVVNNTPTNRKKISSAAKKIRTLREERDGINADIQSVLEGCKVFGVPKKVLKKCIERRFLDADKLEHNDEAYAMCREALGIPLQRSMFK